MKKTLIIATFFAVLFTTNTYATEELIINAPSAILLDTHGNIIYEKNADEVKEPASVTKIMTMLLVMESIEMGKISFDDIVTVSQLAESQGGSQVFLEAGETISVNDLLKSIAVSSANDACIAIAEHIAGSHENFVANMNKRAEELGMTNTFFVNSNGLPEENHVTTAKDISLMSVELLKYDDIYNYTTIWMDSIRDGEFELANTNKMLKTYPGMIGLKTGYTSSALYCISATASKDGEQFIAITMGSETVDERTEDIENMLDYAFTNYKTIELEINEELDELIVLNGQEEKINLSMAQNNKKILAEKNATLTYDIVYKENLTAPIKIGETLGKINFYIDDNQVEIIDILANEDVYEINFKYIMKKLLSNFFKISQ